MDFPSANVQVGQNFDATRSSQIHGLTGRNGQHDDRQFAGHRDFHDIFNGCGRHNQRVIAVDVGRDRDRI